MKSLHSEGQHIIQLIQEAFQKRSTSLKGSKVILFGSRARGNAKQRSDFDVGIIRQKPLPLNTFFDLQEDLQNLPTLYKIDLVDLNRTSKDFQKIALQDTKLIFSA